MNLDIFFENYRRNKYKRTLWSWNKVLRFIACWNEKELSLLFHRRIKCEIYNISFEILHENSTNTKISKILFVYNPISWKLFNCMYRRWLCSWQLSPLKILEWILLFLFRMNFQLQRWIGSTINCIPVAAFKENEVCDSVSYQRRLHDNKNEFFNVVLCVFQKMSPIRLCTHCLLFTQFCLLLHHLYSQLFLSTRIAVFWCFIFWNLCEITLSISIRPIVVSPDVLSIVAVSLINSTIIESRNLCRFSHWIFFDYY